MRSRGDINMLGPFGQSMIHISYRLRPLVRDSLLRAFVSDSAYARGDTYDMPERGVNGVPPGDGRDDAMGRSVGVIPTRIPRLPGVWFGERLGVPTVPPPNDVVCCCCDPVAPPCSCGGVPSVSICAPPLFAVSLLGSFPNDVAGVPCDVAGKPAPSPALRSLSLTILPLPPSLLSLSSPTDRSPPPASARAPIFSRLFFDTQKVQYLQTFANRL